MFKYFKGKKTYATAAATIFGTAAAYVTGHVAGPDAAQLVVTALIGAFIRSGIGNSGAAPE